MCIWFKKLLKYQAVRISITVMLCVTLFVSQGAGDAAAVLPPAQGQPAQPQPAGRGGEMLPPGCVRTAGRPRGLPAGAQYPIQWPILRPSGIFPCLGKSGLIYTVVPLLKDTLERGHPFRGDSSAWQQVLSTNYECM